jgi:hypothetical protein
MLRHSFLRLTFKISNNQSDKKKRMMCFIEEVFLLVTLLRGIRGGYMKQQQNKSNVMDSGNAQDGPKFG